ncbi:MAG TPA: hypothetical protein VKU02_27910 [Gemmataceae bacterium]|nr:hypothetical protein [Gemmataceae bacterium]
MVIEKPARRMTLRQQLTHAEKCSRDVIEHIQGSLLPSISDVRDLSRPVRRRSHYPTMISLSNALNKLQQGGVEINQILEYLHEQLQEIRDRARRERVNRV